MNIECCSCGKKISENEMFLLDNENNIYCNDCFKEESITYYIVDGEKVGDEHNSSVYRDLQGLKDGLERQIKYLKKEIDKREYNYFTDFCKEKLKSFQELYKNIWSGGINEKIS